ncbi:beta-N-acetylhexosaminidase [Sphingomonas sp. C3-2]|uniref:beta-N-acetylhexosaminidase n=1 Tax=Sphingomonas sp. C3-2 TaxID=3062169 RepID=UPI00294B7B18|nr:beta-N-acetylhexosaminidase [Sphingomonas sp. C3-2]WOK35712.1 beta-N-acetylhexosaminidase [Sphingomonas sp. C3-2]
MKPVIYGLEGLELSANERSFFAEARPAGYILFKRNCADRAQLRRLTDSLRAIDGRADLPILIDQEGGRVARMRPPEWPEFPAAGAPFGALYDVAPVSAIEAARANAQALALTLAEVGVTVDCLPLLDVRQEGASDVIGDRSFGSDPMRVAALGRAVLDGLRRGGCVGVVKHMPGHGRALVDSHLKLPVVDADAEALEADLAPFIALKDAPMAMSAHIIYKAWDPDRPATISPIVINDIIRDRIGFDGLLMTDDIDMKALAGTAGEKAAAAVAAGCDLALDCWARMDEMIDIANSLDDIRPESRARLDRAMASLTPDPQGDLAALVARRDALLSYA